MARDQRASGSHEEALRKDARWRPTAHRGATRGEGCDRCHSSVHGATLSRAARSRPRRPIARAASLARRRPAVSSRSRKSKTFSIPPNPGSNPPPRLLSPFQRERSEEAWLVYCFMGTLLLHWRARVDAAGTLEMAVDIGGAAISRKEADVVLAEDHQAGDRPGDRSSTAILDAATRWLTGLRVPVSERDLLSGPPIRERDKPESARQRVSSCY
jgi:hypothetical protein